MSDKYKYLERADKLLRKGRMDAAVQEMIQAVDADPADIAIRQRAAEMAITAGRGADAGRLLGGLFDQQIASGETGQAVTTYRKLSRVAAPGPERALAFARAVEPSNRNEALEAYEAAVAGFMQRGRETHAAEALSSVVRLVPSAENYERLGELAARLGNNDAAGRAFYRAGHLQQSTGGDPYADLERAYHFCASEPRIAVAFAEAQLSRADYDGALTTVEPLLDEDLDAGAREHVRAVYGEALVKTGQWEKAQPFVLEFASQDRRALELAYELMAQMFVSASVQDAVQFARTLDKEAGRAGQRREFIARLKAAAQQVTPSLPLLEYEAEVFNSHSESDYCATLLKLFELHYASGNFARAADCLDRAAEVDAYEPGHAGRLAMLKGHVEPKLYNNIAQRVGGATGQRADTTGNQAADKTTENVLEDLMLQAEIFLQYGMRPRALERLERIQKVFPGEETRNEKLAQLFVSAGLNVTAAPNTPAAAPETAGGNRINDLARITEITRNVYRQGNVKSVLFTAVNEIGRHWNASRCIAVLATPGKPPSIAMEYVSPGLRQSDVMNVVKMVALIQPLALAHGPLMVGDDNGFDSSMRARTSSLRSFIRSMGIQSMLVVPLVENEEHVGLLALGQSDVPRHWTGEDLAVLKTIAEQVSLAVTNAKLRSLVKNLAVTEEASGLLKRSSYLDLLTSEVRRALTHKSALTLMLLQFGRRSEMTKQLGEQNLELMMRDAGQLITSHIRQHDAALRYDKTTVALILAETNERTGQLVAAKLKGVMQGARVPGSDDPPPMIIGFAELVLRDEYDVVDIVTEGINRAEAALDAASKQGPAGVASLAPAEAASA